MSGIQISGLLSNQAFDWKSVVDQLIAADSTPVTTLKTQQTKDASQVTALQAVATALTNLQDSVQAIRAGDLFSARNVSSDTSGTTWKSNSASGAAIGAYKFAVQQLATQAQTTGAGDIGMGLSASSDVSGVTLANANLGTAVTAGTFTVNGQPVTVALTDSLADVFSKISTATGGQVTASYNPGPGVGADGVTLTSAGGELVLGAANDTSNFLAAMKLANNATNTSSSSSALGTVKVNSPLASAGLQTPISAVDGSGNGSFTVNGVAIKYNINTDSLNTVISRINGSSAGVNARYDAANDRVIVTNQNTGDTGIGLSESGNGFLAAVGLTTGAKFAHGKNALVTINDGPVISSASNTLDASVTGITGLSVTVNTQSTQTVTVDSDTSSMQSAIQTFLNNFNAVQDLIANDTKVTIGGANVTSAVLAGNHEVDDWATQLRSLAFNAVSGITGSVKSLSDLGIDFNSTSGDLTIKNPDTLANALSDHPDDVQSFFLSPTDGMVSRMFSFVTNANSANSAQQSSLTKDSSDIDSQISILQARLSQERSQLTNSFVAMLDAQSTAQSQNTYLTSTYFNNNSSSCWVARVVYGAGNPRWLIFRHWLLRRAPGWFRSLYLRHGERFATWLADKPRVQAVIRRWMDARIVGLVPACPLH